MNIGVNVSFWVGKKKIRHTAKEDEYPQENVLNIISH